MKERPRRLTYKEQREFEQLEKDLEALGKEKTGLEEELSSGQLSNDDLIAKSNRVAEVIALIDEKEMRWLELSEFAN